MGTNLSTKKGRHVKVDKQGGGWKGYEYVRGAPGNMSSWGYATDHATGAKRDPGAAATAKKNHREKIIKQRSRLTKAAESCKGNPPGKFRVCVADKIAELKAGGDK